MEFKPHNYQRAAVKHILSNRFSGCFLDLGMGKTISTLTALTELLDGLEVSKVLIIAPKLVCETVWGSEIDKWDHTRHLRISVIAGTAKQRKLALMRNADIYTVSRDNIAWLVDQYPVREKWPFDMVVIDESSSFKNSQSQRFKALRKVIPFCYRVVLLTGTPAPNSLEDLWAQMYLLDRGERLGRTLTRYREAYFKKRWNGFGWEIREGCEPFIHDRIKDICLSMQAKDYLDLPKRIDVVRKVKLARMDKYKEFVQDEVLKLEQSGEEITPMSAAALYSKLLQFCNGAVYDENRNVHEVDESKLLAVKEAVEELQGNPCIIFYQFRSDIPRLKKMIPEAEEMDGKPEMVGKWNSGKVPVLLAHAASMGHGLNMQHGGHNMFWFGLPWALEQYQQAVARLDRQGQTKPVVNVKFICDGTVEELVEARLGDKAMTQGQLIEALKKHVL